MFRTLTLATLLAPLALTAGCFFLVPSCDDELSEEDLAGEAYEVGHKTKGPYGKSKKLKRGKIHSVYGRLAEVDFSNGRRRWVDVKDLDPPGRITRLPEDDECAFDEDDAVMATRSKSGRTLDGKLLASSQPGHVVKPCGKYAQVKYKDGGLDWAPCATMKERDDSDDDKEEKKADDGDKGKGGGGDVCAFRPSKGKYVRCTTFAAGKCVAGSRACKPRSKCVYRPDEGKHVRCSTFSSGKCRSGKKACKPPSKCMFSKKKGKYVQCSSFHGGVCKSGSVACKP